MTDEQIAKAKEMAERVLAGVDHVKEAEDCAEEVLRFVQLLWGERGFSPEQAVFATAIATIHMRETFPGGKARFDEIAHAAHLHYHSEEKR